MGSPKGILMMKSNITDFDNGDGVAQLMAGGCGCLTRAASEQQDSPHFCSNHLSACRPLLSSRSLRGRGHDCDFPPARALTWWSPCTVAVHQWRCVGKRITGGCYSTRSEPGRTAIRWSSDYGKRRAGMGCGKNARVPDHTFNYYYTEYDKKPKP